MSLFFFLPTSYTSTDLAVSVTDSTPTGFDSGFSPFGGVTSNSTTVSVTANGTGSYTYQWAQTGDPATDGPFTCNNPTGPTTTWYAVCNDTSTQNSEQWRCTVTDTGNGLTGSVFVTVTLNWADIN